MCCAQRIYLKALNEKILKKMKTAIEQEYPDVHSCKNLLKYLGIL